MKRIIRNIKKIFRRDIYAKISTSNRGELLIGKKVVVTGGASGIGAEITKAFINQGAEVLILGRNENKIKEFIKDIETDKINYLIWDVSDVSCIKNKFDEALSILGRIDIWVNNAGIYKNINCLECKVSDWEEIFDTNIKGPYFITNRVIEYFIKNGIEGNILNISSETGVIAMTNPYAFTKNILIQYTEGLAYEFSKYNIKVNAIAPGGVATSIAGKLSSNDPLNFGSLGGRLIVPEEVAELALFLASPLNTCLNGQVVFANSGNTLLRPNNYTNR